VYTPIDSSSDSPGSRFCRSEGPIHGCWYDPVIEQRGSWGHQGEQSTKVWISDDWFSWLKVV